MVFCWQPELPLLWNLTGPHTGTDTGVLTGLHSDSSRMQTGRSSLLGSPGNSFRIVILPGKTVRSRYICNCKSPLTEVIFNVSRCVSDDNYSATADFDFKNYQRKISSKPRINNSHRWAKHLFTFKAALVTMPTFIGVAEPRFKFTESVRKFNSNLIGADTAHICKQSAYILLTEICWKSFNRSYTC